MFKKMDQRPPLGQAGLLLVLFLSVVVVEGVGALDIIQVSIDNSQGFATPPPGSIGPLNPSFAGFSIEWGSGLWGYVQPSALNTTLQFYQNLKTASGAAPVMRIGGNSADYTWYVHNIDLSFYIIFYILTVLRGIFSSSSSSTLPIVPFRSLFSASLSLLSPSPSRPLFPSVFSFFPFSFLSLHSRARIVALTFFKYFHTQGEGWRSDHPVMAYDQ